MKFWKISIVSVSLPSGHLSNIVREWYHLRQSDKTQEMRNWRTLAWAQRTFPLQSQHQIRTLAPLAKYSQHNTSNKFIIKTSSEHLDLPSPRATSKLKVWNEVSNNGTLLWYLVSCCYIEKILRDFNVFIKTDEPYFVGGRVFIDTHHDDALRNVSLAAPWWMKRSSSETNFEVSYGIFLWHFCSHCVTYDCRLISLQTGERTVKVAQSVLLC